MSEGRPALRAQSLLVMSEVALSTTLLAASALLVASFVRLTHVDAGFSTDRIVFAGVALSPTHYPDGRARAALYDRLLTGVRRLPGITAASLASEAPLDGEAHVRTFSIEHETRRLDERPVINIRYVDPGYFKTLGITLTRGRLFEDSDRGRHVAVLNERTAATGWPELDPIGRLFREGNEHHPFCEVIGLVRDTREVSLHKAPYLMGYLPYWEDETPESAVLVLKTDLDATAATPLVVSAVHGVDREIPVPRVQTFRETVDEAVAPDRFQMMLVTGFALVAMVLAAIGVYGVPAFAVARRTREMGIRLALGAAPGALVRLVMVQSLAPVASGIALGFAGAVLASRLLEGLLFESSGIAWGALTLVSACVAAIALAACYLPARRVIGIDPTVAIRGIEE
jgi:putative ABC transport system permease protein